MNDQLHVLIVEDNPDDAELIVLELEAANYQVIYQQVDTAEAMVAAIDSQTWDVILTDYSMPHFSAFAALNIVKQRDLDTPFIVVSGSIGEEVAVQLMRDGAHDYLLKDNLTRLAPVIDRELREAKVRHERKQALAKIEFLAFRDELTGLHNRNAFLNFLQHKINSNSNFLVVFIDISQYRQIKYGFGHIKSEQLIIDIGKRLQNYLQPGDLLAKIGKDEFAMLVSNYSDIVQIKTITTELHELIDPPFDLEGFIVYASMTIGVVTSSLKFQEAEECLRAAEIANHNAKKQGFQDTTVVYDPSMQAQAIARLEIETELRKAISEHQLQLFYQPIIELDSFKLAGFEALIRWQHPQKGWISPCEFIPLAEQTGLIIPLGKIILELAFQQMKIWEREFCNDITLSVAVNMSGVQLEEAAIVPEIIHKYQSLCLNKVTLKIEITESSLLNNTQKIVKSLEKFREAGIPISIDDFGTGYSSLSYLRDLPIDVLKIDRAFVSRLEDHKNYGIAQAIINLSNTLGLDVVAEGVETTSQMQLLRLLGSKYGQGYLFSPPIPANKVEDFLKSIKKKIVNHHKFFPQFKAKDQIMI